MMVDPTPVAVVAGGPGVVTIDVTSLALGLGAILWAITSIVQIIQAILLAEVVREQKRISALIVEETIRLRTHDPR